MALNYTYNQIINRLEAFFGAHEIVQAFTHGDLQFADIDKFPTYPRVHAIPLDMAIDGNELTYTFEFIVFGLPRVEDDKQDNIAEVLSDTAQILQDFINAIRRGDSNILNIYDLETTFGTAEPFWDGLNQKVAGWQVQIEITTPYTWNACVIPVAGVTPPTPPTPTCEDAAVTVNGDAFDTVASGGTLDVPVELGDGTPVGTITDGVVVITYPPCDDATVNINGVLYDTVPSGDTINVPVINTAADQVGAISGSNFVIGDVSIKKAIDGTTFTTVKAEGSFNVQRVRSYLKNTPATTFDNNTPELSVIAQDIRTVTITFQDGQAGEAAVSVSPETATIDGASTPTLRIYDIGTDGAGLIGSITSTPQIDAFVQDVSDSGSANLITAIQAEFCAPCADASVTVNSSAFNTVAAGGALNVPVQYVNGTPVGTITAGVVQIPNPVTQSGIAYRRPIYSQKNSYNAAGTLDNTRTKDEGGHLRNGRYDYTPPAYPVSFAALNFSASDPYVTLASNNSFGNTNRWTAADGTQTFPNVYRVDNLTGLGWWATEVNGLANWQNQLDYVDAATDGGYTDWRVPTNDEFKSIIWEGGTGWNPTYFGSMSQITFWTCTTNPDNLTQAIQVFATKYFTRTAKSGSAYTLMVRNHF